MESFQEYFKGLLNDIGTAQSEEAIQFGRRGHINLNNLTFEELNLLITCNEVLNAINSVKRHKNNYPSDNLLNEYFSEASDLPSGHIADLFNLYLILVTFPRVGLSVI